MKKLIMLTVCALAVGAFATDIIPVGKWPRTINVPGKQVVNPTVDTCVDAGYRLLIESSPDIPTGQKLKSKTIIQDPVDRTQCKYQYEYEDLPAPKPQPTPWAITEVPATDVTFKFTEDGRLMGVVWKNAKSSTNTVEK